MAITLEGRCKTGLGKSMTPPRSSVLLTCAPGMAQFLERLIEKVLAGGGWLAVTTWLAQVEGAGGR